MNGLHLYTGNRLELLVRQLAEVLAQGEAGRSPFEPEQVLVQSLGMSRWLALQLAESLGICMNCEFPFPQAFIDGLLAEWVPGMVPEEGDSTREALSKERMTWRIYHLLPGLLEREEFEAVRTYLRDGDALKRFQLSERLANLFDQYLVYRPEMILRWERGEPLLSAAEREMAWQPVLWQAVNAERRVHFAAALEQLRTMELPPGRRLSVFGISSLPPAQVEVLFHLAASRPVHLFLLSPSEEYFGDDLTPRQRARRGITKETGNPLLTAFGRLHMHFREVLMELDERVGTRLVENDGLYVPPREATLLGQLQRDLLSAREPGALPEEGEEPPVYPVDGSLEIHGCHSPMREVEVLYDQLLARLEADPTLLPRDILVMAPDIEGYAPYIHAVFGHPEGESRRIPYSVADRHPRLESRAVDLFLRLLDLVGARCEATEVFSLLESEVFCRRFDFSTDDLARIREWMVESGIRWGMDERQKVAMGLPGLRETTWRAGIDRLLMGMAIRGGNQRMVGGILPVDDMEGEGTALLGRFAEAVELLGRTLEELAEARPLGEWPEALERAVERFFGAEEREEDLVAVRLIREAVEGMGGVARAIGAPEEAVPFAVVKEWLTGALAVHEQRGRFLAGGVTFCALKPMRSVPARVIWLLGMGEGAFPRKALPMQFDLMARDWRLGDRTVRDDDRYLFLEALISARGQLGISYPARSEKSNEALPPSIVVSELLDALVRASGDTELPERLTTMHPLQAFSRRYFVGEEGLFSYSQANAAAQVVSPEGAVALVDRCWPEEEGEAREVRLEELIRCVSGAAAFLLERRMGVRFRRGEAALPDSEPLELDPLSRFRLMDEELALRLYVEDKLGPRSEEAALRPRAAARKRSSGTLVARALLPPGEAGAVEYREVEATVGALAERIAAERCAPQPPEERRVEIGGWTLSGRLDRLDDGGLLWYRAGRVREEDRLALWVTHLFHCATAEDAAPARMLGMDDRVAFAAVPMEEARRRLGDLLELYAEALRRVVPFFARASVTYAKMLRSTRGADPMKATRGAWMGGYQSNGECTKEPYPTLYPEPEAALGEEFCDWAARLAGPMLEAEMEEKG